MVVAFQRLGELISGLPSKEFYEARDELWSVHREIERLKHQIHLLVHEREQLLRALEVLQPDE